MVATAALCTAPPLCATTRDPSSPRPSLVSTAASAWLSPCRGSCWGQPMAGASAPGAARSCSRRGTTPGHAVSCPRPGPACCPDILPLLCAAECRGGAALPRPSSSSSRPRPAPHARLDVDKALALVRFYARRLEQGWPWPPTRLGGWTLGPLARRLVPQANLCQERHRVGTLALGQTYRSTGRCQLLDHLRHPALGHRQGAGTKSRWPTVACSRDQGPATLSRRAPAPACRQTGQHADE